jgi:uncharacterized membrane protein
MFPDDPERLPPARRRRARRMLTPLNASERTDFIDHFARRASPSLEFFLFSLLAGLSIGVGLIFNSTPIMLLGTLLAPFMAPMVGVALGTVIGSVRYFIRSLVGLLVGSLLVFGGGALMGYLARNITSLNLSAAYLRAQLSWDDFLVLAIGAILSSAALARFRRNFYVPSVALAYELYLPLTVAGFGFAAKIPFLWPDGLVVFAVHLAWAALLGALTLAILGFRPQTLFGYTLGGAVASLGVILMIGLTGASAVLSAQVALPTPTPTRTPTLTPVPPTSTSTLTPVPPTETPTPTITLTPLTPSPTPSLTITPSPTPVLAFVEAPDEFGGALMRVEPSFQATILSTLSNGTLVQVLSDNPVEQDNAFWVEVIDLEQQIQGWIVQALLIVATPAPNWTP